MVVGTLITLSLRQLRFSHSMVLFVNKAVQYVLFYGLTENVTIDRGKKGGGVNVLFQPAKPNQITINGSHHYQFPFAHFLLHFKYLCMRTVVRHILNRAVKEPA